MPLKLVPATILSLAVAASWPMRADDSPPAGPSPATLTVHAAEPAAYRIPRFITGKFCEHLGANIYNGMDAQILRNSTFADVPFWTGQMSVDGITTFQFERDRIDAELRRQATRSGWPESDLPELVAARSAALAAFWSRVGAAADVEASPDTGPHGGRAQRLNLKAGAGIKQWAWLPVHRTRKYQIELLARSPDLSAVEATLFARDARMACATAKLEKLTGDWQRLTATLDMPDDAPQRVPYRVELSSPTAGQLVIGHLFLRPADHVNGADPDVIRLLKGSRLPLLRWPGGNFVSAYHWEDAVGPIERRPTRPNYAWGGLEPNTFGTGEFIAFCRAVGCEPMICVNAGTGTPEEAARWVEYCNSPVDTPGGALRAAHGHPEPFRVHHWEVGNELWGKWQAHWTTASGYVDRYQQFARAMLKSDPSIKLYACGAPVLWGKAWNDTLISGAANQFQTITDHPLIGGDVPRDTDPWDVYRDFMHVPAVLEHKWSDLRDSMVRGGVHDPRLAVTELQLFAHLGPAPREGKPERLNHLNLVNPGTLAEALYDTLIYHAAVRLQPFVEMVTHSATVNHGGGLRKERERVYANPCHYANLLFAGFAEATPVKTDLSCSSENAPIVLPEIKTAGGDVSFPILDPLAALSPTGDLLLSLVHRGTGGPLRLTITLDRFPASRARIQTLTGPAPWSANTLEAPEAIKPVSSERLVQNNTISLEAPPCSITHVVIPRQ